jgi:Domain of unknown function (DUF4266)
MPFQKGLFHVFLTGSVRVSILVGGLAVAGLVSGCAVVKPAERGILAEPYMESPFNGKRAIRAYENKVLQTLTGSELPAGAPGGGCGCVN